MRRERRAVRGEKHADTVLHRRMPVSLLILTPSLTALLGGRSRDHRYYGTSAFFLFSPVAG